MLLRTRRVKHTKIYPGSGPSCGGKTPTPAFLCVYSGITESVEYKSGSVPGLDRSGDTGHLTALFSLSVVNASSNKCGWWCLSSRRRVKGSIYTILFLQVSVELIIPHPTRRPCSSVRRPQARATRATSRMRTDELY